MMRSFRPLLSALLATAALCAAAPAAATTYVMVEDPVLADQASAVVDARVVAVEPAPVAGRPATDYTVEIERLVAGSAPGTTLIVRVPGGVRPDGLELRVWGVPRFAVGERALLFLVPRDDGTFDILHLALGAFHRTAAAGTPPLALRDLAGAEVVDLPSLEPRAEGERARDYDAFAGWLADRAAGIERPADYFLDAPPHALARISERFTLINGGGMNLRWFEFDSGGSVPWHAHSAGQAGLPGGGFNEFRQALQAWNGEPRTPVNLTFAGQTGESQGFERFDGTNTLLQGDPNGEIAGSFRCGSGGGTLAIGGAWSSPDQLGTFQGETYRRVLGADIVMNDGIECNEIFNRCYPEFVAVVYAHELGHTLGLGHSCGDSRSPSCTGNPHLAEATMRASAQSDCRGAAIRADDAAGLRRLYQPPGGGRPRGPNAPGGLEGALKEAFVELRWQDNSEDEEGFRIYRSAGGGEFAPLATVDADVTVFFDDAIAPATAYRYRITSFNGQGESGQSQAVEVPVPPVTPVTVDLALAQPEEFRVGEPVELRATFSGPAEIAEWDFGGGGVGFNDTRCLPNAFCRSHVFTTPGPRTVEVVLVGDFGQVARDTLEVVVADAPFETVAAESFFQSAIFGQRGNTGTFESNVWLHNAGPRAALLELSYLPRGLEAPPAPRTLTLAPAESIFLPNVLEKVFGISAGQGSLALTARHADTGDGPPRVFAASRSFVELANRAQGSFGQLVPQQDESAWTAADKVATGILQGDGFLSTLLAVNVDDRPGRVDVELTDRHGDPVGDPVPFALGPGIMRFRPTGDVFPGVEEREGPFTARFRSNGILFLASSTLLESGSEDQIFLPALEPGEAGAVLLPRVVRSPGQFGVFLTTRVSVLNASPVPTDLTFQLLLRGQNNSAPLEATRTVPAGGVLFLEDVIQDLFDLETATGALQVLWDNSQGVAPQVVALTLSESPQGDRFGMAVQGRPVDQAVTGSGVGFGIEQSELFKSQYGVVNLRDGRTDLLLTLRDGNGAVLGQTDLALKPRQHLELNLVALFGEAAASGQNWSVTTDITSGGPVVPYIANINTSGDVFFVPGQARGGG